jgi:UDP-N-acetylmuramyl tripeptide synthase
MNFFIVLLAKISKFILSKMGRGTAFPGDLALKLNKDILSYFQMPKTTIFVTGTTGKTSVSGTLYEIYKNAGYKTVSNIKGSNLIGGVTTAFIEASKLNGKTKCDVLIIECDERYVKNVFKYITPKYFIINNLSRDQLARNGHFELVFNEIDKSIKKETHLILNADDPLVTKFGLNKKNKITYYGLKENKYSTKESKLNTLDLAYCPICHKKIEFDYFNYGNLGSYKCPNNDYNRPDCKYESELNKNVITIDDRKIKINNTALYNVYNITCCYTLCAVDKVSKDSIVDTLNTLSLKVKRLNEFELDGVHGTILLSKNETPISYNQSLEYIKTKRESKTVAIGFTRVSGRYDLKDLSWMYDINFELLNDKSVERIILIGPFAYDIATRLKLANIDPKKFVYCIDYKNSLDFCIKHTKGNLYCVVYFDLDYYYLDKLKERGINL